MYVCLYVVCVCVREMILVEYIWMQLFVLHKQGLPEEFYKMMQKLSTHLSHELFYFHSLRALEAPESSHASQSCITWRALFYWSVFYPPKIVMIDDKKVLTIVWFMVRCMHKKMRQCFFIRLLSEFPCDGKYVATYRCRLAFVARLTTRKSILCTARIF